MEQGAETAKEKLTKIEEGEGWEEIDEKGKSKKPRKPRSDKGQTRGPRKLKEEEVAPKPKMDAEELEVLSYFACFPYDYIAKRKGKKWALSSKERVALSKGAERILVKRISAFEGEIPPEITFVLTNIGILGTRLMMELFDGTKRK